LGSIYPWGIVSRLVDSPRVYISYSQDSIHTACTWFEFLASQAYPAARRQLHPIARARHAYGAARVQLKRDVKSTGIAWGLARTCARPPCTYVVHAGAAAKHSFCYKPQCCLVSGLSVPFCHQIARSLSPHGVSLCSVGGVRVLCETRRRALIAVPRLFIGFATVASRDFSASAWLTLM